MKRRPPPGPIESRSWPESLLARAVSPGPRPLLHGYDVEADLARHYGFAELLLLALTGEAPSREAGRAFEVALIFLAPLPVSEAPTHAAVLARMCGSPPSGMLGTAGIVLAEQSRAIVEEAAGLLAWLDAPDGPPPEPYRARDEEERASLGRLRAALAPTGLACPAVFDHEPGRLPALLGVLHACGLRDPGRLVAALLFARLPSLAAEGLAVEPGHLADYPIDLPDFEYLEESGDD